MKFSTRFFSHLAAGLLMAGSASAQSEDEFIKAFSGEWYVFDKSIQDSGQTCSITLSAKGDSGLLPASATGCAATLDEAANWMIDSGRIVVSDGTAPIAVLGGNQFRVTGELANTDKTIIMERSDGDGNSARLAASLNRHKCYFLGYTQDCAQSKTLRLPQIDEEVGFVTVKTLADLNARAQPRRDAATLGKIAAGTEVKFNQCLTASDGNWCRAKVGDSDIWLAMTALRMDEWPIVTYQVVQMP